MSSTGFDLNTVSAAFGLISSYLAVMRDESGAMKGIAPYLIAGISAS